MATLHVVANIVTQLDQDKAAVESYVYAIHRTPGADGVPRDMIGAGRYLDRFERRNDEWRIAKRRVLVDWFKEYPDSADWTIGPFGIVGVPRGARKPDDESYAWFS